MKRLRIALRGGAMFDVDISDDWNLDPELVKFPPPPGEGTERLRFIKTSEIAAIVEVRTTSGQ
jgi:hypothetical protein